MKDKTIRILLAGANPYNANKGVAALAISAIRLISEIAQENKIKVEICIYTHESNRVYDYIHLPGQCVKIRNIYPSNPFGLKNIFKILTSKWKLYNLIELYKCDYIFNVTAGDSFSDIYGIDNFNAVNNINKLAQLFGINYTFLPQTYGPFYDSNIEKKAMRSLSKADLLLSRDALSTEYLRSHIGNQNIKSYIDMAFYLPYKHFENLIMPGLNVGINISQTLWNIPKDNVIHLSYPYKEVVYETINHLLAKGCIVHIIPHVVNSDNHEDNEYCLSYKIWEKLNHKNVKLAPLFLSPVDAKSYISSLDLFIGARMHACIAAFSSGVPVLPMSYSRKFEGLFNSTLNYKYGINLTTLDSIAQLKEDISEAIANRDQISGLIKHINNTIVADQLAEIKGILKSILVKAINKQ